jgi:predicted Holliday junction resolvase-like endonuclease
MKPPLFIASVILALIPLILTINLIFMGQKNQSLQAELQSQQVEINRGQMSHDIGVNILKEVGQASIKDSKLKDMLNRLGYSVQMSSPSPAPGAASSTPEAIPSATP